MADQIPAAQEIAALTDRGIALLRQSLAASSCASLYLICDPILVNPIGDQAQELAYPTRPLEFRYRDLERSLHPLLIEIKDEQREERFINDSIRLAVQESMAARATSPAARSMCAWIIAPDVTLASMAEVLGTRALLGNPYAIGEKRLFRFWDPRVFDHLPRIFGESMFAEWGASNMQWLYVDISGTMKSQRFDSPLLGKTKENFTPTTAQWDAISRLGDLNQVLQLSDAWSQPDLAATSARLDSALHRAATLGVNASLDAITYALLYHSVGGAFEHHPRMRPIFAEVSKGASLATMLADVEQATWDQIRAAQRTSPITAVFKPGADS